MTDSTSTLTSMRAALEPAPIRLSDLPPLVRDVCERAIEHAQTMSGSWEEAHLEGEAGLIRVEYGPCCDVCITARRLAAALEEGK